MDRHVSMSSASSTPARISTKQLPPWEVHNLPQVPYMTPHSPPLTTPEKHALPTLWAARTSENPNVSPPATTSPISPEPYFGQSSPISKQDPWGAEQYRARELPPTPPSPARSYSAPARPVVSAPVVPAYERTYTPPQEPRPLVVAMPGTMSARSSARSASPFKTRKRGASGDRRRAIAREVRSERSEPFGRRFKSAFREIFRRDPVDPSSFERIEDRHWADE